MFDSDDVFQKVFVPMSGCFTIIQCCTDDKYRDTLQKVCECVSLETYYEKMLNNIRSL